MNTNTITTIGIMATFSIGLANLTYSVFNNKKTSFINTVTNSRIKWISELRSYISEYISLIPLDDSAYMGEYLNRNELFKKINNTKLLIELMINKEDIFDKSVLDIVTEIHKYILEIYKCVDLRYKTKLPYYSTLDIMGNEELIKRLVSELEDNTANIIKKELIKLLKLTEDNDKDNIITTNANAVIEDCEFKGCHRIDDAYLGCVNELIKQLRGKIQELVQKSQELLKNEWDRVKRESEDGKYIEKEKNEWSVIEGIKQTNKVIKVIKVILGIMTICIIALIFIA